MAGITLAVLGDIAEAGLHLLGNFQILAGLLCAKLDFAIFTYYLTVFIRQDLLVRGPV